MLNTAYEILSQDFLSSFTNGLKVKDITYFVLGEINKLSGGFDNIKSVVLYGSYAKGLQHMDSDIDLAVVVANNENIRFLDDKLLDIQCEVMDKFDQAMVHLMIYEENEIDLMENVYSGKHFILKEFEQ